MQGQFAGRRDEHARGLAVENAAVAATGAGGLALLIALLERHKRATFLSGQAVERGQHESGRFSGAGLRGDDQVATFEGGRDGLRLDGVGSV